MSATGRGSKRSKQDLYETPQPVADAIARWALSKCATEPTAILEPGCGTKAPFLAAVGERLPAMKERAFRGVELGGEPKHPVNSLPIASGTDYLTWEPTRGFDLIITNPPFSAAQAFLSKSFTLLRSPGIIVFLLRLGWLESWKRLLTLHRHMPPDYVGVLVPRPSFTEGGTDATAYAAFAYCSPERFKEPRVEWITWGKEEKDALPKEA